MKNSKPLKIQAQINNLKKVRRYIESRLLAYKVDDITDREDILLAVMEAVTNICVHGYQNHKGWIEIEVTKGEDTITIFLRDEAPYFDPASIRAPDISIPLEDRPIGGMGIHLIRQVMDQVANHSLPQGGNELVLTKRIRLNDKT